MEAQDNATSYEVTLGAPPFKARPMAVDAHWGADAAARMALEVYRRAWINAAKFLAEERTEARHMAEDRRQAHLTWAEEVVRAASVLGSRIEEASTSAAEPEEAVDVTDRVDESLGLLETGHELALGTLVSEGRSLTEAYEILARRAFQDIAGKWRFSPSRRIPTAAHG